MQTIVIRNMGFKQAKKEILEYFKKRKGENVFPSEVMENLGIDIKTVFKILEKLKKEGRIEE